MTPDPTPTPWLLRLPPPGDAPAAAGLPDDTLGLALSGGGVRSAAFGLGVLQALARAGWLRRVDYLSTVSGGGYVGAFVGRFFDLCGKPAGLTGDVPNATPGAAQDRVARDLADSRSAPVAWLRQHANYLSPTGLGEAVTNVAAFWRNLLSVYLVLALFLLAVFGAVDAVEYAGRPWGPGPAAAVAALTPLTDTLLDRVGPWAGLAELAVWLAVAPLMVAYWLVSQDRPEAFVGPVVAAAGVLAAGLLVATASPVGVAVLALAVVWALGAWAAVRRAEGRRDPNHPARLLLARNHLTRRLAFWFAATAVLAGVAVVDGLGRWLAGRMADGGLTVGNVGGWAAVVAAAVLGLAAGLRVLVRVVVGSGGPAGAVAAARPYLWSALALLGGAVPPLVALSFAGHAAYGLGADYYQGLAVTAAAAVVSLLLGSRECVPFINRSGPLMVYADRLARAFLGAVNPGRRVHPEGRNVTYVVPGDDVPLADYRPHAAGGPLHVINCAVNETVDVASRRGLRDRQAENLAVGPAGVSVAREWHAAWTDGGSAVEAVGAGDGPHPFAPTAEGPVAVEPLSLRVWVGVSGAAVSPGSGRRTGPARALLFTLANLRLGYWWDSGLAAAGRRDVPLKTGLWPALSAALAAVFRAQALLVAELAGRFPGPWERYWNLSDGGHFENTGAYELIRRRVPFVILCDAGHDPNHRGEGFARLVRVTRVDFGAEFEEVTGEALRPLGVPDGVAPRLGGLADLLPAAGLPRAHAALFRVRHPGGPPNPDRDPWLARGHTWLLYVKSTRTGDEPADVRAYAAEHPDFPNETTLDQVFDEPQWESYRRLGEHAGEGLFA